jgi:arylsulfatase A-like enzyme
MKAWVALVLLLQPLLAGCSAGPAGEAPTVPRHLLLISVDTLGALHVGAYGYERDTSPVLGRLAERGVLFENAYTQQVWTLTSHLSLMTSLNPQSHAASEHQAAWPAAPTLAGVLRNAGFETAAFTGVGAYMNPRYGLGRGFDRYVIGKTDAERDNAPRIAWLREQARKVAADPKHRFFLFAHYFDVHSDVGTSVPYDAPEADRQAYLTQVLPEGEAWQREGDTDLLIELEKSGEASDRDRAVIRALYDAGVRYTDRAGVGALLAELEATGLARETLVVLTSDHGEEIFEHGKVSHQQPYEETARVPLVFAGPGVPRGERIGDLVELVDVMPTVLAQLGVPAPEGLQGRDLSPLWRGEALPARAAHVDGFFGGLPTLKWRYPSSITELIGGVRYSYVGDVGYEATPEGGRRFFFYREGQLFDLDADPGQTRDLARERPLLARRLRKSLLAWYDENERRARELERASRAVGEGAVVPGPSEAEAEQLRALGYGD